MIRSLIATLVLVALGAPTLSTAAELNTSVNYASACKHYQNRARFKPRREPYEFITVMADACDAAHESLNAPTEGEREAAHTFLARLVVVRDTVVQMNIGRVYGTTNPHPFAKIKGRNGKLMAIPKVSATGEYLIAHQTGLIAAYRDWLDSGTDFSLALR